MVKNTKESYRAFSLVELLMALLVASLLMAALAPVMTRKSNTDNVSISDTVNRKIPSCAFVNDNFTNIEKECLVPNDAKVANIIVVSGGGGGGGAVPSVEGNWEFVKAVNGKDGKNEQIRSEYQLDENIKNLKVKLMSGGGGGGAGNYGIKFAPGATSCAGLSGSDTIGKTNYATYDSASKLCVTKYNQVSNSDHATYKVTSYNDTKCTSNYTHTCEETQKSMSYAYSGCKRPVCTYAGGVAACNYLKSKTGFKWRLPKLAELEKWSSQYTNLALCTRDATGIPYSKVARCNDSGSHYTGICYSGSSTTCSFLAGPSFIRGMEASTSSPDNYAIATLTSEGLSPGYGSAGNLRSTRCVMETEYNLYSGGGGSSGHFIEYEVPENIIKFATKNGEKGIALLVAGGGGKGGTKNTSSDAGRTSYFDVANKDGSRIWSANNGSAAKAGQNASTNAPGTPGGATNETSAYYDYLSKTYGFNGDNTKITTMSYNTLSTLVKGFRHIAGNNGSNNTGGVSVWPDAGEYGKGGEGGNCSLDDNSTPVCTDGTDGKGGRIELYAKKIYPGAGGAGGNAGGVLHVKNINVSYGETIKIGIGKAGSGGNSGGNGTDGGNSYVEFQNGDRYEVLGGKGGKTGAMAIVPISGNVTDATGGVSQEIDKNIVTAETKNILNSKNKNDVKIYPENNGDILKLKGNNAPEKYSLSKAPGGNGGTNNKISGLTGIKGIPCGGYSKTSIAINKNEYKCGDGELPTLNSSPNALYRSIAERDLIDKTSNYIQNYAPGATGGGGGGWFYDYASGIESTGRGQDGLGGYVLIYFE